MPEQYSGIIRVVKDRDYPYKVINTTFANDRRLTFESRGVLAYLLSKPDGWELQTQDLINQSAAGREKILRILRELEETGYLVRERLHAEKGRWKWIKLVYETPRAPESANPPTAEPETVNAAVYKERKLTSKNSKTHISRKGYDEHVENERIRQSVERLTGEG